MYQVIGIGNALVDIQVKVDEEFLAETGFPKGQMTLSEHGEQEKLLKKLKKKSRNICSGGSAANTIHGLGALGAHTYYIGRVADDEYGRHYTQDMVDCSVGFPGPDSADAGTGTSVVMITPDAQRTMVTNLGISTSLHPDNVDETLLSNAEIVYVEGYLFTGESTRAAAKKIARLARRHGKKVAFTLSDVFVVKNFLYEIRQFLEWHTDILFCNDTEGMALVGGHNPLQAFEYLSGICQTVFFTRGNKGAWAQSVHGAPVKSRPFPVEAVDTTGAGDLFAAGALYGLLHKRNIEECCIIGNYVASEVVSHLGARLPAHSHSSIPKILETYRDRIEQRP